MKKRADGRYVETITIDGKRKFFYGASEREVRRKIADFDAELKKYPSFSEIADEWKEEHFKDIEFGTKVSYEPAISRAKEFYSGYEINEIEPVDIRNILTYLSKKDYSQQTVRIQKIVLKQIFDHAIYLGYIKTNPTETVKIPKGLSVKKRDMPTDEQLKIIEENKDLSQMGFFAYFLLYTGLRRGEALALTWSDIDSENKTISVRKTAEIKVNKPEIKAYTKTEAGMRDVIIMDILLPDIEKRRGKTDEYVFAGNNGAMTKSELRKRWNRYCIDTGMYESEENKQGSIKKIPALTPHQLRHGYVTMLYESGLDEKEAITQTGHANEAVMRDIYTHLREKKKSGIAEKINKFSW